jgi:hypothetical protein
VELLGLLARQQAEAEHGVLVHADEPAGLPDPATFGDVIQQRHDLVWGQAAVEERSAFAFGKAGFAGAAAEQAAMVRAIASGDGQVAVTAFAVIEAVRVLTAKGAQLVHGAFRGRVGSRNDLTAGLAQRYTRPAEPTMLIRHDRVSGHSETTQVPSDCQ